MKNLRYENRKFPENHKKGVPMGLQGHFREFQEPFKGVPAGFVGVWMRLWRFQGRFKVILFELQECFKGF